MVRGGPRVPGYAILGTLGRGAMGVVYRATDLRLNRTVALKMVLAGGHADDDARARFRVEAQAVARLQHPNIVQIFEVGEADGLPFCALEFVPGGTLAAALAGVPQDSFAAAGRAAVLAGALAAVHAAGLIHRDLKPANVLLAVDGTAKITDFGIAKRLDDIAARTIDGQVMGTPSYMAPEQAEGRLDRIGPPTDIWALGAILYEMLTGRPPFRGTGVRDTLDQVLTRDPVPVRRLLPGCPRDLETVCLKCLEKDPARRYSAAAELADDLTRYLTGRPVLARRSGPLEQALKWARRYPYRAATAAAGILLVAAAVAVVTVQARADRVQARVDRAEAEVRRQEVAELRRRDEATNRITSLYRRAEVGTAEADRLPPKPPGGATSGPGSSATPPRPSTSSGGSRTRPPARSATRRRNCSPGRGPGSATPGGGPTPAPGSAS